MHFSFAEFVVFQYHDGLVHKLPPGDLTIQNVYPRMTVLEKYLGKTRLETGMEVRLRWNNRYKRSKAVIMGIGKDSKLLDDLFQSLDDDRKSKVIVWLCCANELGFRYLMGIGDIG